MLWYAATCSEMLRNAMTHYETLRNATTRYDTKGWKMLWCYGLIQNAYDTVQHFTKCYTCYKALFIHIIKGVRRRRTWFSTNQQITNNNKHPCYSKIKCVHKYKYLTEEENKLKKITNINIYAHTIILWLVMNILFHFLVFDIWTSLQFHTYPFHSLSPQS